MDWAEKLPAPPTPPKVPTPVEIKQEVTQVLGKQVGGIYWSQAKQSEEEPQAKRQKHPLRSLDWNSNSKANKHIYRFWIFCVRGPSLRGDGGSSLCGELTVHV